MVSDAISGTLLDETFRIFAKFNEVMLVVENFLHFLL